MAINEGLPIPNSTLPLEVRARFRRASQNFCADFQNSPSPNHHLTTHQQPSSKPQPNNPNSTKSSSPLFCVPKWHLHTVRKTKPPTWASTVSTTSSSATQEKKPALPVSLLPNLNV